MIRVLFVFLVMPFVDFAQEQMYDSTLYQNMNDFKNRIEINNLEIDSTIAISNKNSGLIDTLFYTEFMECQLQLYKSSFDGRVFIIELKGSNQEVLKLLYPKYALVPDQTWEKYGKQKNELPIFCEGMVLLINKQGNSYSFLLEDMFIL